MFSQKPIFPRYSSLIGAIRTHPMKDSYKSQLSNDSQNVIKEEGDISMFIQWNKESREVSQNLKKFLVFQESS